MMDSTDRCPGNALPKHVTLACDACRKKRRKCDARTPCASCSSTGNQCVYSKSDGRRQRHEQKKKKDTPGQAAVVRTPVRDIASAVHNGDRDTGCEQGDGSAAVDALQTRRDNEAERQIIPRLGSNTNGTIPLRQRSVKTILPSDSNGERSGSLAGTKLNTMKSMQGVFSRRADKASPTTTVGTSHLSRARLLPKIAPTRRTSRNTRSSNYRHDRISNQRHLDQAVWHSGSKGYAVPGYTRTFGNLPFSSAIKANGYPANVQARQSLNFLAPLHLIYPLTEADENPLGLALTDFQQLAQRLIADGNPSSQVADAGLIDVTLFYRARLSEDPVNASSWTAEMLKAFRGTFSDKLLLACAACVARLMCWLVVPTPQNYANIPSMMRPTELQRMKPHPSWVDLMMFPTFRNALTNSLRDWVEPCINAKWDFLWPHPVDTALIHDTTTQRIYLTPQFTAYVDNPKNWSMQRIILRSFPEAEASEINIVQE